MNRRFRNPYREIIGLAILVAVVLGFISPLAAQQSKKDDSSRKFGPLEKSLLIPGWGQLSEKRYIEGALFLAAEAFCIYSAIANNHRGNESYSLYKTATTMDDAVNARRLTERYDTRRNQFILAGAAVWAINLIDIHLIVKSKGGKEKSLSLKVSYEKNAVGLVASGRF